MIKEYGTYDPNVNPLVIVLEDDMFKIKTYIEPKIWEFDYVAYLRRLFHKSIVVAIIFEEYSKAENIINEYLQKNNVQF